VGLDRGLPPYSRWRRAAEARDGDPPRRGRSQARQCARAKPGDVLQPKRVATEEAGRELSLGFQAQLATVHAPDLRDTTDPVARLRADRQLGGAARVDDPNGRGLDESLQSVEADVNRFAQAGHGDRPPRRMPLVPAPLVRRRRHRRWRESFPRDRVGARPWTAIARRTRPHGSTAGPTGLRSPSAVCGPRPSGQIRLLGDAARPSSSGRCNRTHWHTGAPCASAPPRALTIPVSTRSGSAGSPGWSSTAARWPRT